MTTATDPYDVDGDAPSLDVVISTACAQLVERLHEHRPHYQADQALAAWRELGTGVLYLLRALRCTLDQIPTDARHVDLVERPALVEELDAARRAVDDANARREAAARAHAAEQRQLLDRVAELEQAIASGTAPPRSFDCQAIVSAVVLGGEDPEPLWRRLGEIFQPDAEPETTVGPAPVPPDGWTLGDLIRYHLSDDVDGSRLAALRALVGWADGQLPGQTTIADAVPVATPATLDDDLTVAQVTEWFVLEHGGPRFVVDVLDAVAAQVDADEWSEILLAVPRALARLTTTPPQTPQDDPAPEPGDDPPSDDDTAQDDPTTGEDDPTTGDDATTTDGLTWDQDGDAAVLAILDRFPDGLTASAIARAVGMPPGSSFAVMRRLAEAGDVEQVTSGHRRLWIRP